MTEVENLISEFADDDTRAYLSRVLERLNDATGLGVAAKSRKAFSREIAELPRSFTADCLTKDLLAAIVFHGDAEKSKWHREAPGRLAVAMVNVAIETGYCLDYDLLWFEKRIDTINRRFANPTRAILDVLRSPRRCRQHEIVEVVDDIGSTMAKKGDSKPIIVETDLESEAIIGLVAEFLTGHKMRRVYHAFRYWKEFSASLDGDVPNDEFGFGASTIERQRRYFDGGPLALIAMISEFHVWCADRRPEGQPMFVPEDGITYDFVCSQNFSHFLIEGYRAILWSPEDPVPDADKWYLYPNGAEGKTAQGKPNEAIAVDATVPNDTLKRVLKKWLWQMRCNSMKTIKSKANAVRRLFGDLTQVPIIVKDGNEVLVVTSSLVQKAILKRRGEISPNSMARERGAIKEFLEFAEAEGVVSVEPLCKYLLGQPSGQQLAKSAEPADRENIGKVRDRLAEKAGLSLRDALCYIVFCLTCLTPLRISEVLDLKVDSVQEIGRKGLYGIRGKSKTTGAGEKFVQVAKQAKTLVEAAVELTRDVRANASIEMKEYVFLLPARRGSTRCLSSQVYSKALKATCKELDVPPILTENVRKRYQTDVKLKGVEKGWSQAGIRALTGHDDPSTDDRSYFRPDIRPYLLAVYGVEIGTRPVDGTIMDEGMEGEDSDLVENGCGWCRNPECNVQGMKSCLMCKGFWTTPAHIPEFKEMVAIADAKIANANLSHDKQSVIATKRLALRYLAELMEKQDKGRSSR